jgi:thymidine kinase
MQKCGKLDLIIGPMFSGKSSELIRIARRLRVINSPYIVIKPTIDKRYESNRIVSHDKESELCLVTDDLELILDTEINNFNTIIIDEGQFLKNLKKKVLYWVEELNKHVIIGGLDGDYKRKPIGEILDLLPYSDSCKKVSALCKYCNDGTPGLFSHRNTECNEQILIGSNDVYISLCRYHYLKSNN